MSQTQMHGFPLVFPISRHSSPRMTLSKPFIFSSRNQKPNLDTTVLLPNSTTLWSWQSFKDLAYCSLEHIITKERRFIQQPRKPNSGLNGWWWSNIDWTFLFTRRDKWLNPIGTYLLLKKLKISFFMINFFKWRNSKCTSIWVQSITILLWNFRNILSQFF